MLINIDHKALEHACQCAGRSVHHFDRMSDDLPLRASIIAHARAIEQHEAFKREVSEAVADAMDDWPVALPLQLFIALENMKRFIITKPDPLVEAWEAMLRDSKPGDDRIEVFRAAIKARGGKIVWEK